jgi:transposase
MALPEQCRKEGVMVDWKKLLPPRGFVVLPRRWVVERSFAWMLRRPWTTNAPLV